MALESGISCFDHWQMSLSEISATITVYGKRQKERLKEKCALDYTLAKLISFSVNAPDEFPGRAEIYPIFDNDESGVEDWRAVKAYMTAVSQTRREVDND